MEKNKMPSQLEEVTEEDTRKVYDEFFDHAMHLLNDHQQPLELVAGTMIAIAQRMYKTQLNEEEYEAMMDVIRDAPVKPYGVKKVRLN
jgi:tRNA C32,U32 (ribose-2'-O)-methylase TrmJ